MSSLLRSAGAVGIAVLLGTLPAFADDWPQWGGTCGKNMASGERGLPASFVPGKKDYREGRVDPATATNVRWGRKVCASTYSSPVVADGKVFLCGNQDGGVIACLDERTGEILWRWQGGSTAHYFGICATPVVDCDRTGDRLYVVNQDSVMMCLDVNGGGEPDSQAAKVLWTFDIQKAFKTEPADVFCGSCLVDGDVVYAPTSNGIDPLGDRRFKMFLYGNRPGSKDGRVIVRDPEVYRVTSPDAPNVVAFDKRTGRLVATDTMPITKGMLKGQWSSIGAGDVRAGDGDGRRLLFYGGGDGRCYAMEPLTGVPDDRSTLKTVWSCDCNPPEYQQFGEHPRIVHYYLGNSRWGGSLNANDGKFQGMCEIVGTPVFHRNRIYVAIGRDPAHGRGRGALQCIDATKAGDVTKDGIMWTYQGLDWTCSTVSIADGLVFVADVVGRLHCVDAATGKCHWVYETKTRELMGSTLVADGKVYMPTQRGLFVLAASKEMRLLAKINVGAPIYSTPVAANGTLYVTSDKGWIWAVGK